MDGVRVTGLVLWGRDYGWGHGYGAGVIGWMGWGDGSRAISWDDGVGVVEPTPPGTRAGPYQGEEAAGHTSELPHGWDLGKKESAAERGARGGGTPCSPVHRAAAPTGGTRTAPGFPSHPGPPELMTHPRHGHLFVLLSDRLMFLMAHNHFSEVI